MNRDRCIDIFTTLARRLADFGADEVSRAVIAEATRRNEWFTPGDIIFAVRAIREHMLPREVLEKWLPEAGPTESSSENKPTGNIDPPSGSPAANPAAPKKVALIAPGNIPLVGFSDLLCILAAERACYLKPSSKDEPLMRYVVSLLRDIAHDIPIHDYRDGDAYDAVIATGSDNTNRYFRQRFCNTPSIMRGSRGSLAILRGDESDVELAALARDVFTYSGLGCRNVSLVLVPEGYDVQSLGRKLVSTRENAGLSLSPSPGYRNNYLRRRALLAVRRDPFIDCGSFVMVRGDAFPDDVSQLNYAFYSDDEALRRWLADNECSVQCVVGRGVAFERVAAFGMAQCPSPWDYPDGVDVLKFLKTINVHTEHLICTI